MFYDYPPISDMKDIAIEIVPELKTDIEGMNTEDLKNIFKEIMTELKKQDQKA